jgi:hypothetical protein
LLPTIPVRGRRPYGTEYFNSESFNPENEQSDDRIVDIDPSRSQEVEQISFLVTHQK